jgi:NADPH-dependent curcumin reductase CurA
VWQLLDGFGVSKVVMSNNPNFKEGDYVSSWTKWEEYSIIPGGKQLTVVDPSLCPLSYHLGCLGMSITSHFNLSLQIKIIHLIMDNFLHISWLWLEQFSHWPCFIFIAIWK